MIWWFVTSVPKVPVLKEHMLENFLFIIKITPIVIYFSLQRTTFHMAYGTETKTK